MVNDLKIIWLFEVVGKQRMTIGVASRSSWKPNCGENLLGLS